MKRKNQYAYNAGISERQLEQTVELFAMDLEATKISELTGINRKTVNNYLHKIRQRIAEFCEEEAQLQGEIEVDESYFGPRRVRGKTGRGAGKKTVVFGIFKRNGKVYTEIVPNAKKETLQRVIRGKVSLNSVIHSDGWRSYDGLVDLGYEKHFRVRHDEDEFAVGDSHINGMEAFWSLAKTRLAKRRGIKRQYFYLHLKECEFRYNYRNENLCRKILTILENNPLNYS